MRRRFRSIATQAGGWQSEVSFSSSFALYKVKLIAAHDGNRCLAGGAFSNGGAGADDCGSNVSHQSAEGGPGGGDGIVSGSAAVLGGRCLWAVNALQAIGVVSVEGQRDDAAVHFQRTDLQLQPVSNLADGGKVGIGLKVIFTS